ncbi:MAG: DUF885 family protein [Myxococcales bacterium]|nr:DUF885 family protein [Myxococcales bacterium]MCB9732126.1 DUF885 family protein [Deltaproteobacteria bacterium]
MASRDDVRARFLAHALDRFPEDASSLGAGGDHRLRDPSAAAFEAEERALTALRADAHAWAPASPAAALDRLAMLRRADFRLRTLKDRRARRNLELVALPYAAVAYVESHGRAAGARAAQIPAYLDALGATLRHELARGWVPEPLVVEAFLCEVLPAAAAGLRASGHADAARAYDAFTPVLDACGARAVEGGDALGDDELRFRLASFGVDPPERLAERARASLAEAQAALRARCPGGEPLAKHLARLMAPTLGDDVEAFYVLRCDELVDRARDRLVPWPPNTDVRVRVLAAPPGLAHGNWPCPLFDPDAHGAFLIDPDPAGNPRFWAEVFTVHEAVPGHYLQSAWWQAAHGDGGHAHAVRFLNVADDVAASWQDWGPMVMIEGWAVHAEQIMWRDGYFAGPAADAALVSNALRAVRVLVDLGLQAGRMTPDEAAALYVREACMPEPWARAQVVRHRRIPLQGLTYLAGRLALEDLEAAAAARGVSTLEARRRLLAEGPLPPALLHDIVLGGG